MATFSGIGKLLKDVIFSDLTTTSKNVIGAINELNTGLSNEKYVIKFGNIGGSGVSGHTFALYASVIAVRNAKKIWTVHLNGKITTNTGGSNSTFDFGILLNNLKAVMGISGSISLADGSYQIYDSDGNLYTSYMENGSGFSNNNGILNFGRYYSIDGAFGPWPASLGIFSVGNYVIATLILQEN